MSGRSSWCFTDDHPRCRFAACTCACHVGAVGELPGEVAPLACGTAAAPPVAAVAARPVPAGAQAVLEFADSIDGSTRDVATVTFSLRGQVYEVDLSREHRDRLQASLAPFLAVARPARN